MSSNPINGIFDSTIDGLQKQLELNFRRNQAITSNIANSETPQYRAVDLNFSNELDRAFDKMGGDSSPVKKTDPRHLDTLTDSGAHLISDLSGATKGDGNNVDIDIQMGKLAYNAGQYSLSTNLVAKKLSMLLNAIRQTQS